jgi:hypothetical protein
MDLIFSSAFSEVFYFTFCHEQINISSSSSASSASSSSSWG